MEMQRGRVVVTAAYVARFWKRVHKDDSDGCWIWTGAGDENGYGRATIAPGITVLAHRAAYAIARGALAASECVLHRCDTPPCVRPDHLFKGDRGDNARDMAAKGRQHVQRNPTARPVCPAERRSRGEEHYRARLTTAQVLEIRRRFAAGEHKASLCRAFRVGFCAITAVVRGQTWKHVGGPIQEVA